MRLRPATRLSATLQFQRLECAFLSLRRCATPRPRSVSRHAPSTTLRVVPLPRSAHASQGRITPRRRALLPCAALAAKSSAADCVIQASARIGAGSRYCGSRAARAIHYYFFYFFFFLFLTSLFYSFRSLLPLFFLELNFLFLYVLSVESPAPTVQDFTSTPFPPLVPISGRKSSLFSCLRRDLRPTCDHLDDTPATTKATKLTVFKCITAGGRRGSAPGERGGRSAILLIRTS